MKLIVGLGNPGPRYRNTRHNVGYKAVELLASRLGTSFDREKHESLMAEAVHCGEKLLLLKPLTFMNNSGISVAQAARNKVREPGDILVLVDDVNLPLGRIRVRAGGSAGGHNGLKSLIEHLGTDQFPRVRMGVGESEDAVLRDHVLGTFRPEERGAVDQMIGQAADAAVLFVESGIDAAMNAHNIKGAGKKPDEAS